MSEPVKLKVRMRRRPSSGVDAHDGEGVRQGVKRDIETRFTLAGTLAELARFFGESWEEEADFTKELEEGGREESIAALFRHLAARPEVVRRFREGEVVVERRRLIGLLELIDPATLAWRLDTVFVGEGNAGCGVLVSEWTHTVGEGVDALPEPFREWLDLGRLASSEFDMRARPTGPPTPHIRPTVLTINVPVPPGALGLAALVGLATDAEMCTGPQRARLFFTLRGQVLERWEVWGELPCSLTDFIRLLVQHSKAEGAAFVHPCTVIDAPALTRRGVAIVAERAGAMVRRTLPLTVADDGTITASRPFFEELGPPEEPWIGVPPAEGLTLGWRPSQPTPTGGVVPEG